MRLNLTLLSRILAQPWAIRQEALALLSQLVLAGDSPLRARDEEKPKQQATATPGYAPLNMEGMLAVFDDFLPAIPVGVTGLLVWGTLGRAWTDDERYWLDAIDVDHLIAAIEATPKDSTVVLWFRSPGGIITGIPEAAASLRFLGKSRHLIAFSDDLCASAAYWLAAQCATIFATPTAEIGSIGVYIAFYDFCQYLQKNGVNLELFKAGSLKAIGLPGNPLSDEGRGYLQASVDESYKMFTADVTRNRAIAPEHMQGQTLRGKHASNAKLVDGFYASASAFFASLGK